MCRTCSRHSGLVSRYDEVNGIVFKRQTRFCVFIVVVQRDLLSLVCGRASLQGTAGRQHGRIDGANRLVACVQPAAHVDRAADHRKHRDSHEAERHHDGSLGVARELRKPRAQALNTTKLG